MKISTENLTKVIKQLTDAADKGVFSPFKIVGSAGMDAEGAAGASGLCVGVTAQKFQILNSNTNEKRWLGFTGVGIGYGAEGGPPIGGSLSTENFPSNGSRIAMGLRQWASNFDWADLEGNTFIYSASAGVGVAESIALIMFNYAVSEYYSYGIGFLEGKSVAIHGAGVINFIGMTSYI